MRPHQLLPVLALTVAGVAPPSADAAAAGPAVGPRAVGYAFSGRLLADPPAGANALTLRVAGGNRVALRALLGRRPVQAFRVDRDTRYLRWADGIPAIVTLDDLRAGDRLTIRVRAGARVALASVLSRPAASVAEHDADRTRPAGVVWVFRGQATTAAADGHLGLRVTGGNRRALRSLLGESAVRTFTYGADTVFLRWSRGLPHVVAPPAIGLGDQVTIRLHAPRRTALAALEALPATRMAEHDRSQRPARR